MYSEINYKKINNLLSDHDFIKLNQPLDYKGIFEICGQTNREQWHSYFLRWILDCTETHNLGFFPLERLLCLYNIKKPETFEGIDITNIDRNFSFKKEVSINGGRVDVLGESSDYLIVIEMKVTAKESPKQTSDYYNYFKDNSDYKNKKKLYIFISVDDKATDSHFVNISYQEIYDYMISKCISNPKVSERTRLYLKEYSLALCSYDNNKFMACINKDTCNKVYEKHKDIINEIFKHHINSNKPDIYTRLYKEYARAFSEIYYSVNGKFLSVKYKGKILCKFMIEREMLKTGDVFEYRTRNIFIQAELINIFGEWKILKYEENGINRLVFESSYSEIDQHFYRLTESLNYVIIQLHNRFGLSISTLNVNDSFKRTYDNKSINDILKENGF